MPWVRTATVHVSWPDGVHIAVTEETPRFVVSEAGGQWDTLSADGRVLSVSPARPPGLLLLSVPQPPGAAGTVLPARDEPGLRRGVDPARLLRGTGDGGHGGAGGLGAAEP